MAAAMDNSPRGRVIETVEGDPGAIIGRGNEIKTLGQEMIDSADVLEKIAHGATGQKGLAVDKLHDVVGDCYKQLRLAGHRYQPTGPALIDYGNALADVQPKIRSIVSQAEQDWEAYQQKHGAVPASPLPLAAPTPTPAQKTAYEKAKNDHSDAQAAANTAYENWKDDAETFDGYYDTWETAFDKAVHEIGEADHGGISDSFWDKLDGFVAAALKVLQWVGLVVGILAIIIGGPILGVIAAVVAIAALALTIYSYCRGNSSLTDLVFAVVGVIPFGSVGKLFEDGSRLGFLHDMVGGLGSGEAWGSVKNIGHGLETGFSRGFGSGSDFLGSMSSGLTRGLRGGYLALAGPEGRGLASVSARLFTGKNLDDISKLTNPASILGAVWGDGFAKNVWGTGSAVYGLATG